MSYIPIEVAEEWPVWIMELNHVHNRGRLIEVWPGDRTAKTASETLNRIQDLAGTYPEAQLVPHRLPHDTGTPGQVISNVLSPKDMDYHTKLCAHLNILSMHPPGWYSEPGDWFGPPAQVLKE